jgi:hypothetical protein
MAVKDIKAKDMTVHYTGGYVRGCRGLLEGVLNLQGLDAGVNVKTGPSGRHYLTNTSKRRPGKGGKVAYLEMADGHSYEVRYGGTFRALHVMLAAKASGSVLGLVTQSGTRASRRVG